MDNQGKGKAKKELNDWQIVTVAGFGVLALMGILAFFVHTRVPIPHNSKVFTQDDWQAFADMFGAVAGTFFSAVAFSVLIYSSWMQRKELALQREQLKENQAELRRQADAQESSGKILSSQVDVARLSAQLSAAQALYDYYEDLIPSVPNGPGYPTEDMLEVFYDYVDKVPGYGGTGVEFHRLSYIDQSDELEKMRSAMEVQRDTAVQDMQRVQAELRRVTTAELNVQEKAQTMEASATANIQKDGATVDTDGVLVKSARRLERLLFRRH